MKNLYYYENVRANGSIEQVITESIQEAESKQGFRLATLEDIEFEGRCDGTVYREPVRLAEGAYMLAEVKKIDEFGEVEIEENYIKLDH